MPTRIRSTVVINGVLCPNGETRQFTVQSVIGPNSKRGFIKINKLSVSGIATRKSDKYRWRFMPNMHGKNIALLRTPSIDNGTCVKVTDPEIPLYLKKYHARIVKVAYDGLTPVYDVQFNGGSNKTRTVRHDYLEAVG